MTQNYVVFLVAGESTSTTILEQIETQNVETVNTILSTFNSNNIHPYGYCYSIEEEGLGEVWRGGMYYLTGEVFTLENIQLVNEDLYNIMIENNWSNVIKINDNITLPFTSNDVLLEQ